MQVFAGIDLAWTAHRESGICIFATNDEGGQAQLITLDCCVASPERLRDQITMFGPNVIAAVDAPLLIGPQRRAELALGSYFGRYRASAHSANEALLTSSGRLAGPMLARCLEDVGYTIAADAIPAGAKGLRAVEVYPHASHVVLWKLTERLKYKLKRGRSVADRKAVFTIYQCLLRAIIEAELRGLLELQSMEDALDPETTVRARGTSLKRLEDKLDAITCAIVAWRAWRDGLPAGDILGDKHGFVAIPGLAKDERFNGVREKWSAIKESPEGTPLV